MAEIGWIGAGRHDLTGDRPVRRPRAGWSHRIGRASKRALTGNDPLGGRFPVSAHTGRYENAVTRSFDAWNARESEALARAVAVAWAPQGGYTDPLADVRGHEGVVAVVAAAQAQFPGFVFRLTGAVDGHHDTARFSWELVSETDGEAPVAGSDVIILDAEGRITAVLGFLDRVPATA
jgi:hypothetical protein